MKLIAFILITFSGLNVFSQSKLTTNVELTSRVITAVSAEWKKDSIGKNGYRSQVFERLRYSKVDSVAKKDLFMYLGKPHSISRFFSGNTKKTYVGYRYYVLCMNDYPKEKLFMGLYIEFVFDETETRFIEIQDGDYCG